MDKDRINCDNALDNAYPIRVAEISDMASLILQPIYIDCHPGEFFYSAVDVCLLLSEMGSDPVATPEERKGYLKISNDISKKIFETREAVQ